MRKDLEIQTRRLADSLARHGVTPQGVGWPNEQDLATRFEVLMSAIDWSEYSNSRPLRLLDVGCGPGFLLDWLSQNRLLDRVDYTGVDVTEVTLGHARTRWPKWPFELRDVRERPFAADSFNFAILCGVFTTRYENRYDDMQALATETLRSLWPSVTLGLSFNVMSKHVDWERDDLFHWPLDDIMRFCKASLSRHVCLRLDYGLWETSVLVRRKPAARRSSVPEQWSGSAR